MSTLDLLGANLLSPIVLAFGLGLAARLLRSELRIPPALYNSLAIYLLLALGLKGGHELGHAGWASLAKPAAVTVLLGCITPLTAYLALRRLGRFSTADSAGIAAHYGSVSAVTFIAAQQFVGAMGGAPESFMPTLLALLESPGIHIALGIGVLAKARTAPAPEAVEVSMSAGGAAALGSGPEPVPVPPSLLASLHEVLTGRTMVLLVGGLLVGWLMGDSGWKQVSPFFDTGFKGALMLFLLEMGMLAAERLGELRKVGPFLLAFGTLAPLFHGALGVLLGHLAGLSPSGATVLGAMAASASYIAAPPAVRATLPEANPAFSLALALGITFPFNVVVGIPLFWRLASFLGGR
ncbi:sodium-dependent bicarbonate transport family permease [Geothrix sp. PMB-07]|uniref:sodium-dependent bicarbonate transport family permease n=1 Tax=Geothrix sp. PMB-07 TaxID=3068640 RepID=UPI002742144E|nr:sodium-dependent bicarbonate transport family permease [Geothrix sp. PMB-07]WLT32215.1 sodium-dependent bicarbonate transport family permease [Geothrix sp. PMB-07]